METHITEELRARILLAMPELSQANASKIATTEGCSAVTVYKYWRLLKTMTQPIEANNILLAIAELAASMQKKKGKMEQIKHKRLRHLQQQLSAA